jgi:hypothetical protein
MLSERVTEKNAAGQSSVQADTTHTIPVVEEDEGNNDKSDDELIDPEGLDIRAVQDVSRVQLRHLAANRNTRCFDLA